MKLSSIRYLLSKVAVNALFVTLTCLATSCDSVIYDGEGDCTVHYRVSFRFTKNMLNADAFGSQVTDINLYLFDKDGGLAFHKVDHRNLTTENDYYMDVEVLPGTYDMIAWCEGKSVIDDSVSFIIENSEYPTTIQDLGAYLPLSQEGDEMVSKHDINRLYYGLSENVEFIDSHGVVDISPIYLTKDTNHITVTLQNIDNLEIDPNQLLFTIEGDNNRLNWLNSLSDCDSFTYIPWSEKSLSLDLEESTKSLDTRADGVTNGVQVEFTTGRILENIEQKLTVTNNETGEKILSIPLVQYLLLVRSMYEQATSNQDYLDRYDDFSLVFFVGSDLSWIKTRVLINNWRVVPPQTGVL